MSERTLFQAWKRGLWPALVVLLVLAAAHAAGARGADPPAASIGRVTVPGGTTASGSVGSGGKSDACLNNQHSSADPSASGTNAAQVNDSSCASASGAQSSVGAPTSQTQAAGGTGTTRSATPRTGSSGSSSKRVAAWVFASQASGLFIARVQYVTSGAVVQKRFRLVVTLRDLKGRLVRHAIVSTGRVAGAKTTVTGVQATFTNRLGQARIALPATKAMFGKPVLLRITARTPKARALTIGSVYLPRLGSQ